MWPVNDIIETNAFYRRSTEFTISRPFDSVLFFADPGTGDPFGFTFEPQTTAIYHWSVLDDTLQLVAPDFETYVRQELADTVGT